MAFLHYVVFAYVDVVAYRRGSSAWQWRPTNMAYAHSPINVNLRHVVSITTKYVHTVIGGGDGLSLKFELQRPDGLDTEGAESEGVFLTSSKIWYKQQILGLPLTPLRL
ncbi:hypothetical protein BV22DRAFT_242068 [Leucogyrophana mollusca]|uniref:Uncharacterized protein n=1 Tax=Leucogyrophana mollusca TaxID=85980 RepID=A0ACB8BPV6_9AGAM|nr:hypothetical protein BV22DRAFT_242068 [Leucogyrophana mollusca]